MNRTQKEDVVAALRQVFESANLIVVTHYSGLSVAEATDLRSQMRDAGATFRVTKNRLVKRAIDGTRFGALGELFTGPTAIAYSDDPVAAAKVAVTFAKGNEKLIVLGGALGEERLDAVRVKALADLPSLDELRAQLVGLIGTPATRIAGVLQAPAGQLARVVNAYAHKEEAA